jgi:hypothetical protein
MRKLIVIILCIVLFTTAKSQIYIQGGVNLSNITTTQPAAIQKNSSLASLNAGVLGRIGINYRMGFTKVNSSQIDNSSKDKNNYRTLSISLGFPLFRF